MSAPLKVRRLIDPEGQKLQRIVRRGSTNAVRHRRAMIILASSSGNTVPIIARLVAAGACAPRLTSTFVGLLPAPAIQKL